MSNNSSEATARRRDGRHRAPRLAALAIATVIAMTVVVATMVSALATHASAAGRPSKDGAPRLVAVDRPPVDPNPFAPGLIVASHQDESDPVLYRFSGRYFLYTSGIPGLPPVNVPVASATDFGEWGPVTDALPLLPHWAVPGFTWAPDVHRFGSTYVLYFTAMLQGTTPAMECIGDATGSSPDGPFTASGTPFICQVGQGGSIDPRVFTDVTGTTWMLWKSDQNIAGATTPTKMWSQPLTADGLGLTGTPTFLMGPDEPWQGTIVEAPDMVAVGGAYWVFYSGNWFNQPDYAIGAARCSGPAGPCADASPLPLLGSNAQGEGPGEASVFTDSSGVWMLYSPWHSSAPQPDVPPRPVDITRIGFLPTAPYLAAEVAPPSLDALGTTLLWSAP